MYLKGNCTPGLDAFNLSKDDLLTFFKSFLPYHLLSLCVLLDTEDNLKLVDDNQ